MITNLHIEYNNNAYKFPIGTNILTGKLLRKLIKRYMFDTITIENYNRLWLNGHYISDDTILIYNDDNNVVLFTNEWGGSNEEDRFIPSIITIPISDPIIYVE